MVAIGVDRKDRNVAWVSPDRQTWTKARRPFQGVPHGWAPMQLVACGDRLLAVGSDGMRLAVWSSTDGLRWTRQGDQPAFASGGVDFETMLWATGAAATADRILVTGSFQFDTSQAIRTWWSDDATTWHRVRIDDPALAYVDRPIAVPDGFLAIACCTPLDGPPAVEQLVRSADGITWTVVGTLPREVYGPLAIRPSDGMLFVSGFPGDDRDTPGRVPPGPWSARADGRLFRQAHAARRRRVSSAAASLARVSPSRDARSRSVATRSRR